MIKKIIIIFSLLKQVLSYEFNGEGTTYGGNISSGSCGFKQNSFITHGGMAAAINKEQYGDSSLSCGRCALVKYKNYDPVKIIITDICPECKKGDLDLFNEAWRIIIKEDFGRKKIEWDFINCDLFIDSTIKLRIDEKNEHWFNVQPEHFLCGIKEMYINLNNNWIKMDRDDSKMMGLYFNYNKGISYPFKLKIISIYNEEIITLDYNSISHQIDTQQQFKCSNNISSFTFEDIAGDIEKNKPLTKLRC